MDRLRNLRLSFWLWVHDRAEDFWHWVYYKKVRPLQPPVVTSVPTLFFGDDTAFYCLDDEVDGCSYYRWNPDGTYTKLGGNVDTGQSS